MKKYDFEKMGGDLERRRPEDHRKRRFYRSFWKLGYMGI